MKLSWNSFFSLSSARMLICRPFVRLQCALRFSSDANIIHSHMYIFNVLLFGWKRKLIMKLLVWFLCAHTELLTVNRVKEERYSYPTTTVEKQLCTASNYYLRAILNWFSRICCCCCCVHIPKKSQTVKIENTCFSCCLCCRSGSSSSRFFSVRYNFF